MNGLPPSTSSLRCQDLMFQGDFEMAKMRANQEDKWLLVNLQDSTEFDSHRSADRGRGRVGNLSGWEGSDADIGNPPEHAVPPSIWSKSCTNPQKALRPNR